MQGSLNIRMRYPKNGRYEENDYIAFASASFRQKKHKKPSAGFRDCSPVPFSKFYDTILHIIMSKINDAAHMKISFAKANTRKRKQTVQEHSPTRKLCTLSCAFTNSSSKPSQKLTLCHFMKPRNGGGAGAGSCSGCGA